jgi:hypothetical protein
MPLSHILEILLELHIVILVLEAYLSGTSLEEFGVVWGLRKNLIFNKILCPENSNLKFLP